VLGLMVIVVNKMPEQRDSDVRSSTWDIIKRLSKKAKYAQGVLAQVLYVGAQIMCWTYIYQYAEAIGIDAETAGSYQFVAFLMFFLGRFVCTFLLKYVNSGKLLTSLAILAAMCTAGTIFIPGIYGLYALVGISFCMSLMFPTIYGIALDGLSPDESKIGAAGLVMAIVGGALMPTFQGMILDWGGPGYTDVKVLGVSEVNFSFILPLFCFVLIAIYGYRVFTRYHVADEHINS